MVYLYSVYLFASPLHSWLIITFLSINHSIIHLTTSSNRIAILPYLLIVQTVTPCIRITTELLFRHNPIFPWWHFFVLFTVHVLTFAFISVAFIPSKTGKRLMMLNRYTYYVHSMTSDGRQRWTCSTHTKKGCKAIAYTRDDVLCSSKNQHFHTPPNYYLTADGHYVRIPNIAECYKYTQWPACIFCFNFLCIKYLPLVVLCFVNICSIIIFN